MKTSAEQSLADAYIAARGKLPGDRKVAAWESPRSSYEKVRESPAVAGLSPITIVNARKLVDKYGEISITRVETILAADIGPALVEP